MNEYIVNYEVWVEGRAKAWGNVSLSVNGPQNSGKMADEIRNTVSKENNCEPKQIRIVGVFKL